MHILFYISRFGIGGIQTFVIQMAKELIKKEGIKVSIFCHYPELIDNSQNEVIPPEIEIFTLSKNKDKVVWINRIRNILYKIYPNFDFKEWLTTRYFLMKIKKEQVDLIHNNIELGDYNVYRACKELNIPYITTLHGAYKEITKSSSQEEKDKYKPVFNDLLSTAANIVYLSSLNIKPFEVVLGSLKEVQREKFVRVFNGLNLFKKEDMLAKPKDKIIFGLVARGVHHKGWEEAILAIIELKKQSQGMPIELRLYGASDYLDELKEKYKTYKDFILFCGATNEPIKVVQEFTVGLLPTYLPQEEMPFTIIEYLACQVPVIATNKGAIPEMLDAGGDIAGEIIGFDTNGHACVQELMKTMCRFAEDENYRSEKTLLAALAFEKFNIKNTVKEYYNLYQKAINQ